MRRLQSPALAWIVVAAFTGFAALGCSQHPAGQAQNQQATEQAQKAAVPALVTEADAAEPQHAARQAPRGRRIQGRVVRLQGQDRVVVRTADKREVILHTNTQTKFLRNNRAVRFADVREGAEIDALFEVTGDQNLASSVTISSAEAQAADVVEGTVVRVVEADNQIIVRTASDKEVIVVVDERTKFTFNDRSARLIDFRSGTPVRVQFDVSNQKNMARSVVAMPKRSR